MRDGARGIINILGSMAPHFNSDFFSNTYLHGLQIDLHRNIKHLERREWWNDARGGVVKRGLVQEMCRKCGLTGLTDAGLIQRSVIGVKKSLDVVGVF